MGLHKVIKEIEASYAIQQLGFGEEVIPCQHLFLKNNIYGCEAENGEVLYPKECLYQLNKRGFFYNSCYELSPTDLMYLLRAKEKQS